MATKGLYLQRGLKREKKSHRKLILLLAALFAIGVLIAPFLWKKSRTKPLQESSSPVSATVKGDKISSQIMVSGKIPKTGSAVALQDNNPSQEKQIPGGAVSQEQVKSQNIASQETPTLQQKGEEAATVTKPSSGTPAPYVGAVEKQQSPYELRAELKQKELAEDAKAKEIVAQSALKEMPLPSASSAGSGTSPAGVDQTKPAGKHTVVSMLTPEKGQKKPEQAQTSPEKSSAKAQTMLKGKQVSTKQQGAAVSSPVVSKPAETKPPQEVSSAPRLEGLSHLIQVGAYREEANAKKVKAIVDGLGYEALIKESSHPRLGKIYIVRVPVKGSKTEAQKVMSLISQKTGDKPILMESR